MANREFSAFQLTLREISLLVLFAAAGIASLRLGGIVAACFLVFTILLCMSMAITSLVDRGIRQAYAIGFVLCVAIYAAVVLASSGNEFDPYECKLPTSKLLLPAFKVIVTQTWMDSATQKEVPDYDPSLAIVKPFAGPVVFVIEVPDRPTFMSVGHVLWALLFGYIGAKFATFTYQRRLQRG